MRVRFRERVFITAGPITKLCAWGEEESGGHERRRAEACVDESAHHALVNAGGVSELTAYSRRHDQDSKSRFGMPNFDSVNFCTTRV